MSLSERLKKAEQERARTHPSLGHDPAIDLTDDDDHVLDLTAMATKPIPLFGPDGPPRTSYSTEGVSYSPVRNGDATSAFGEPDSFIADRSSTTPCPRCGGRTQLDLIDQVHQTASLSCLECFHMFRVDA